VILKHWWSTLWWWTTTCCPCPEIVVMCFRKNTKRVEISRIY
jgi:hypothetical protein